MMDHDEFARAIEGLKLTEDQRTLLVLVVSKYSDNLPTKSQFEALTNVLGALVDNDISYNDRDLVIRCANSGEAMHKVFEARAILAKVREKRG